jgi:hypothetical protein
MFVAETAGCFKEASWLDNSGHPHPKALRKIVQKLLTPELC